MFLWRLFHWGPILALLIVKCITYSTLQVTSMWFAPFSTYSGIFCYAAFLLSVGLTLYNFFCAALIGPGYLPFEWGPENAADSKYLQKCILCQGYKAPRAHHCRKCNRCVKKMDHHCPWINNCVGHQNHAQFVLFLVFAVLGSLQSCIYLSIGLYRAFNYRYYVYYLNHRNLAYFSLFHLIFTIFSLGLAIGVILALSGLFFIQMKSILRNETNIENWIVIKAVNRPRESKDVFIYPYNLGYWKNFKFVFLSTVSDGITFPLVKGCNQYTLTTEQLQQKYEKKVRSKKYTIMHDYSGAIFPISKGIRTCCCPPCTDEPRIPINVGDSVIVTRWKRRWLYGEKQVKEPVGDAPKGWFPRICAAELINPELSKKVLKKFQ